MKPILPLALLCTLSACQSSAVEKPNVLFIMVDDLRPVLGTYGFPDVLSPNIDRLAAEGIQFNRSYCNVPVCGASRASLLTGIRPLYPKRFNNYLTRADEDTPEAVSLPEHFKNNGFTALSNGKIFHHWEDNAGAWSQNPYRPEKQQSTPGQTMIQYHDPSSKDYINPKTGMGPYFEASDVPDSFHIDGSLSLKVINDLERFSKSGEPFFLAVGFIKPHLPFNAPKKYFDLYSNIEIAGNRFSPENLPDLVKNSGEIFGYGRLDHYNTIEFHHEARLAYYACVSFIDAQIGMLLQSLKELNLDKNTIIVLIGDHGFHLGEHNFWGKHNTLHNAIHAPLIIKVPGMKPREINEIVEFTDIYPTLCELTGLEMPDHLQGESMVSLMKGNEKNWKNFLITEWVGARTLLTDQYSYTFWHDKPTWIKEEIEGVEMLFDHKADPLENKNVVSESRYKDIATFHKNLLDSLYLIIK